MCNMHLRTVVFELWSSSMRRGGGSLVSLWCGDITRAIFTSVNRNSIHRCARVLITSLNLKFLDSKRWWFWLSATFNAMASDRWLFRRRWPGRTRAHSGIIRLSWSGFRKHGRLSYTRVLIIAIFRYPLHSCGMHIISVEKTSLRF